MTHICVSNLNSIGSDNGLSAPSHYQNQCWNIVKRTLRNKLQWNFNRNSNIFIQEIAFESVVCEKAAILSRPQWVKLISKWSSDECQKTSLMIVKIDSDNGLVPAGIKPSHESILTKLYDAIRSRKYESLPCIWKLHIWNQSHLLWDNESFLPVEIPAGLNSPHTTPSLGYRKISNIRCTKSPNLNVTRLVVQ